MKKWISIAVAILALALFAVGQTHDTTPPALTAFSFIPTNPDATAGPATVTFTVTATDDLSGVASIQLEASNGSVLQSASWSGTGGTSTTQTLTMTLPQYSPGGTWSISYVMLTDAAGNRRAWTTPQLALAGFPTIFTVQ